MIVRVLMLGLVLLTTLLLQSVIAPVLAVAGTSPQLVVLTVVGLGLGEGPGTGLRYGFAAGLAVDLLGPPDHLVGVHTLVLLLIGYGAGAVRPYLAGSDTGGQVLVGAIASALAVAGSGVLELLLGLGGRNPLDLGLQAAVAAGYGALLAPFVCRLVQAISRRVPAAPPVGV